MRLWSGDITLGLGIFSCFAAKRGMPQRNAEKLRWVRL